MNFSRKKDHCSASSVSKKIKPPSVAEQQSFISNLEKIAPRAAAISSFLVRPRISSKYPVLPSLPPTIVSLSRVHYKELSKSELEKVCQYIFHTLSMTSEESTLLFQSTLLQSNSILWYEHRKGRLTASTFGDVFHTLVLLKQLHYLCRRGRNFLRTNWWVWRRCCYRPKDQEFCGLLAPSESTSQPLAFACSLEAAPAKSALYNLARAIV